MSEEELQEGGSDTERDTCLRHWMKARDTCREDHKRR